MIESLICLVIAAGSLGVAVWTLATGQIGRQGLDALFLVLVCLLISAAFSPFAWRAIREWRRSIGGQAK